MNNLDKFRYSYDDPSQLNISLKKDPYEKVNDFKSNNLNQLLLEHLVELEKLHFLIKANLQVF